jgi:hypothetical protein
MAAVQDKIVSFDWTEDRAISCKALIDGNKVSDRQISELKERMALLVREVIPGRYAKVGATVAERNKRTWTTNGDKIEIVPDEE